jgi:hypothetical protein
VTEAAPSQVSILPNLYSPFGKGELS